MVPLLRRADFSQYAARRARLAGNVLTKSMDKSLMDALKVLENLGKLPVVKEFVPSGLPGHPPHVREVPASMKEYARAAQEALDSLLSFDHKKHPLKL